MLSLSPPIPLNFLRTHPRVRAPSGAHGVDSPFARIIPKLSELSNISLFERGILWS